MGFQLPFFGSPCSWQPCICFGMARGGVV